MMHLFLSLLITCIFLFYILVSLLPFSYIFFFNQVGLHSMFSLLILRFSRVHYCIPFFTSLFCSNEHFFPTHEILSPFPFPLNRWDLYDTFTFFPLLNLLSSLLIFLLFYFPSAHPLHQLSFILFCFVFPKILFI